MRKRFEVELGLGQTPVSKIYISPKSKNALDQLIAALKELYCNAEYNNKIFSIIEKHLPKADRKNGRPGMNLWTVFVLSQVRMCLGAGYSMLHNLSNNHRLLRQLIGVEDEFGAEPFTFEYQNIYDNVSRLGDEMLKELNDTVVEFGHREVFKKKKPQPCA
jgi:disulfide oxidoreductase YuzD